MNDNYRKIYSEIYKQKSHLQSSDRDESSAITLVRGVMEEVINSFQKTDKLILREDAFVLIFVLFKDLIVQPILASKSMTEETIKGYVRDDLTFVFQHVHPTGEREVSGHLVLEAILSEWGKLKLTSLEIWS